MKSKVFSTWLFFMLMVLALAWMVERCTALPWPGMQAQHIAPTIVEVEKGEVCQSRWIYRGALSR